jgi:hypothetical protein
MLEEYLTMYEEALQNKDEKAIKRIERELGMLGMDKYTLMILMGERRKSK